MRTRRVLGQGPGVRPIAQHVTNLVVAQLVMMALPGPGLAQEAEVGDGVREDLLVAGPLPSAPEAITLTEAFAIADRDANDLELARLQVLRGEAAERIAWAALLPVVTGGLTYQRFDQPIVRATTVTDPDGTMRTDQLVVRDENSLQGSITVSETFSMRSVGAVRIAEATSDVARLELEDLRRRVRATIARTFFTVLAARRASELARSQIADAVRQLTAARVRARLGAAVGLDVARAEVAALDGLRRAADADQALGRAWDQLGDALGRGTPLDAAPSRLVEAPSDEAAAIARASGARADVRRAAAGRELASRVIDDAWFRFIPTLSISWTGSFTEPRTAFSPNTQWIALASLSVPFYDGGARYGAVRDAELAAQQADERVEATQRLVRLEVRDALRRLEAAARTKALAERQVEVARRAAQAAEAGFGAGAVTGLELDAARRALEQSELSLVLAELAHENARVDLLSATGEI